VAILLCATLSGCSGTSSDSNTGGGEPVLKSIPEQIEIDTQSLVPVSDEEARDGKALFKSLMIAHSLQKHILIPIDESAKERSVRQTAFSKLSATQKAAVQSINKNCQVVENPALQRSSLTFRESIRTKGDQCPADLSRATVLTYTVQSSDRQGKNGSASISGTIRLHQQYKEDSLVQATELSLSDLIGTYRGLTLISQSGSKTYFQITSGGSAQMKDAGPVQVSIKAESLGDEDSRRIIYYVRLATPSHEYNFAARFEAGPSDIETVEFYSGDHKLTAKEAGELHAEDLIRQF
jgi:hypothetical protein